jgi:hypothetical protein
MTERTTIPIQQTIAKRPFERAAERRSRILREFARYEGSLQEWTERCTINAIWYLSDPFGAIRSANLGIEEELICELETLHEEFDRQRKFSPHARRSA